MEKFEPKNIKGAADFLPSTQIVRNRVTDVLRRNFESYGFLPLETALLNYYDLLSYKYESDAEILREIYKLKDQGERDLGLRFDLTVPFCKVIAMNRNLRLPFKRYEIGKVFRNGPVKLGRTREFYQCDVDCVGVGGVYIEAEFVALTLKCFEEIGIPVCIHIGNRKLLSALIGAVGVESSKTDAVIGIVDKLAKVSREQILADLEKYMKKDTAKHLLEVISFEVDAIEKQFVSSEKVMSAVKEVKELWAALGDNAKKCKFTPYLARGLNIYTGTVWEVFDTKGRVTGSLAAGGRYDNIITNFISDGRAYPAVGISFGLEPIMAVLSHNEETVVTPVDLMLIPMGTEVSTQQFACNLRAQGLRVLVYLGGKGVGKAFDYANAENIPWVAVVGENETKSGIIEIKKMSDGTKAQFKMKEATKIKEALK